MTSYSKKPASEVFSWRDIFFVFFRRFHHGLRSGHTNRVHDGSLNPAYPVWRHQVTGTYLWRWRRLATRCWSVMTRHTMRWIASTTTYWWISPYWRFTCRTVDSTSSSVEMPPTSGYVRISFVFGAPTWWWWAHLEWGACVCINERVHMNHDGNDAIDTRLNVPLANLHRRKRDSSGRGNLNMTHYKSNFWMLKFNSTSLVIWISRVMNVSHCETVSLRTVAFNLKKT